MIIVESYFLKPNTVVKSLSSEYFISLDQTEQLQKQLNLRQPVYPGYISLHDEHHQALGLEYHDSVDGLWLGILSILESLAEKGHGYAGFTYQSLILQMKISEEGMLMTEILFKDSVQQRAEFPGREAVRGLIAGAEIFFETVFSLPLQLFEFEKEEIRNRVHKLKELTAK
ncbi:hypothetical protein GJU40_12830 [Bacillus lacus]|uniref:Uncharacterized protein n=1 Tax=Metabacillus lacus TaxID=1983721 RepID=A0A7X2LZ43_9BACI|nr:hypothetical protein [Metabacillus lacus]MRX73026.1 hypothetical protein [Metabacillus lacus]